VSDEKTAVRISNSEEVIFVGRNPRDREVFINYSEDGAFEGISLFDSRDCRDLADELHEAANWLDAQSSAQLVHTDLA
jgi:hypothetical protein